MRLRYSLLLPCAAIAVVPCLLVAPWFSAREALSTAPAISSSSLVPALLWNGVPGLVLAVLVGLLAARGMYRHIVILLGSSIAFCVWAYGPLLFSPHLRGGHGGPGEVLPALAFIPILHLLVLALAYLAGLLLARSVRPSAA